MRQVGGDCRAHSRSRRKFLFVGRASLFEFFGNRRYALMSLSCYRIVHCIASTVFPLGNDGKCKEMYGYSYGPGMIWANGTESRPDRERARVATRCGCPPY